MQQPNTQYALVPVKHLRTLTVFALGGALIIGYQVGRKPKTINNLHYTAKK